MRRVNALSFIIGTLTRLNNYELCIMNYALNYSHSIVAGGLELMS